MDIYNGPVVDSGVVFRCMYPIFYQKKSSKSSRTALSVPPGNGKGRQLPPFCFPISSPL